MFDWLKREKFVLPPEEYQRKLVSEIEEKLKDAKGSEKTKLTYMLGNQLMILNQILNKIVFVISNRIINLKFN